MELYVKNGSVGVCRIWSYETECVIIAFVRRASLVGMPKLEHNLIEYVAADTVVCLFKLHEYLVDVDVESFVSR